jgi:threonine/homoserine/homoserine lactone efflux protein
MIPTPDLASLGLFVLAALVLLLTPGPAVLYIVARSIDQGRRAGVVSMLGVHAGTLVHIAAAAAGVSALLAASATAFSAVKYLGAVYLVYLGVRRILARAPTVGDGPARERRLPRRRCSSSPSSRSSSTCRAATSARRSSCSAGSSWRWGSSPTAASR